ncbi:hypothetical protein ES702_03506 [subsurface metagenome]
METSSLSIIGRNITNAYYDFQQVRIASMNRVRDVIRKLVDGIKFDEVETKKEKKEYKKKYTDKELLSKLNKLLTDDKILAEEHEYVMECWDIMQDSKKLEKKFQKAMETFISKEAVYNEFLSKIRGIAEILSANLIKEFGDCSKYDTVSKLWAHTGNGVIDGIAPKRKKGETLSFSPRLKTLTWKLSDSLMKQNKGVYRGIYLKEKEKQLNREYEVGYLHEKYPEKKKNGKDVYPESTTQLILGHAHNRALRKMRKIFLDHYWNASRELNGLPTEKNYVEGVLNHSHIITWREAIEKEGTLKK